MHEGGHFYWQDLIPGLHGIPHHVFAMAMAAGLLAFFVIVVRAQLARAVATQNGAIVPDSKLSLRNFFELIAEKLHGLCESVMGKHATHQFYPVVSSIFIVIFVSNLMGIIPGFFPATENLNTTMALGTFVFFYYNYIGLKENGMAYLKHFAGPVVWLAPLFIIIEVVSHVFRPISLGLRLWGNILGDHKVLGTFSDLMQWVLPIPFFGLGLFVAFMQAFVFTMMTMVYISLSTAHDH